MGTRITSTCTRAPVWCGPQASPLCMQPIKGQPLIESRAASITEQDLIWVWTHVVWQTCLWKTEGFLVDFCFLCEYWDEVISLE